MTIAIATSAAYQDALRGDFEPLLRLRAGLGDHDHTTRRILEPLLAAAIATVDTDEAGPDPESLAIATGADDWRPLTLRACHLMGLRALLQMDGAGLQRWARAAERIAGDGPPVLVVDLLQGWNAVASGDVSWIDRADAIATRAAGEANGALRVEATTLTALAQLVAGRLPDALATARRASRMAGSEGFLIEEYLANVTLARIRRHAGRGYLSARILRVLDGVVPAPLRPWIAWELAFAGAVPDTGADHGAVPTAAPFTAAARGDRPAFAQALAALKQIGASMRFAVDDCTALADGLDPAAAGEHPWCRAAAEGPFISLQAACSGGDENLAWVVAIEGRPPRRILQSGLGFLPAALRTLAGHARKDARVVSAAADLMLAGPAGRTTADLFQRVYGFDFVRDRHDSVLRVLLHRVRQLVDPAATLERDGDHVVLRPVRDLAIPDPRCNESLDERVLRSLAAAPKGVTAEDMASAVGVSRRSAIASLQRLAGEGTCRKERAQRAMLYRLEDTTFGEPTYARLRGNYRRAP